MKGSREIRFFNRAVRDGHLGKDPKEVRKGVLWFSSIWGNSVQGRGKSKVKDPEVGSNKELRVAGAGREKGKIRPQRACSPATSE